jgi:hypothetical protein
MPRGGRWGVVGKSVIAENDRLQRGGVTNSAHTALVGAGCPADATQPAAPPPAKRRPIPLGASEASRTDLSLRPRSTWAQAEGSPLPLGVTWIEEEQAFNFAVHSEHAESVTLLLYSSADLVNPLLTFRFDFLRNKPGRIWHCRIPLTEIGEACYYAYSVSGETSSCLHNFDPHKVLLDPYAKCVFFPPCFDRKLAMQEGPNAGRLRPRVQSNQLRSTSFS